MNNLCERSCDICNLRMYCQGCSLCEMPFCKFDCEQCFSLCPRRGFSWHYLAQVGGGQVTLQGNMSRQLPALIPVLPDHMPEAIDVGQVVGIHGGNFFSENGERVAPVYRRKGIQDTLNLLQPVKGVLQFYVKDRTLEGIWDKRREIYAQLQEFPWQAIIAPNYSVYEDAPRIDHLYNIKRSSIVYNEMLDAGLPAVPDISWYNKIDLDQWIQEINSKGVRCIAFSFQTVGTGLRASNFYVHYLAAFKYLTERIPAETEIIVAGMVSSKRVQFLKDVCSNPLSVLNQSAYVHSRRGILSETGKAPGELTKNQILLRNLAYYDKSYRREAEICPRTGTAELLQEELTR
ncbi:DUF4417 domain-containing protein [Anaerotruncus sp. 80]|uniref:DUF4417 domain-containing protein n=2 Tax=Anaerotruncus colihominis TaxID=169435 RepID=A0A845QL62_9FIRM|nr:DUF4417 domain-containing protein [Anaerotruncus colihominis]NCF02470.1 DUF4417 domain-containing protein [Anaerotruncus sp. 80]